MWNFTFFIKSIFLGAGLAMDAFSVSLANGLNEPKMKTGKMSLVSGVFSFFQFLMPVAGWVCVHTMVSIFTAFETYIPFIALVLLAFIGSKMLVEGVTGENSSGKSPSVGLKTLALQGIATSIDALSVGFTISDYNFAMAFVCCVIIAAVTFFICTAGLFIGRAFGTKASKKASVFGGIILVTIGFEIFITGIR